MKISTVLVGLVMIFELIHGFENVITACNEYWLQVRIKRRLYLNYQLPRHYELYLGTGCPVTGELLDFFEFLYPIHSCGIKSEVRPWGILLESFITYVPMNLDIGVYFHISCCIQRRVLFIYPNNMIGNNSPAYKKSMRKSNTTSQQQENSGTHSGVTFGVLLFDDMCKLGENRSSL
ncbi:oocyte-secreted protein 4A-like [Tupaia chinensis]|uniref:oocyte-secreted protein 4A-like n=1 Tax=Tupaia chinensis TaxID=246437 RepID=UPI000FFBD288|nr:oocyte-secreted protein 4A-like [Tupaia chinensis]